MQALWSPPVPAQSIAEFGRFVDAVWEAGQVYIMFEIDPAAKTDLKPGTLYAIAGEEEWMYHGRVAADKMMEFFHRRDREIADVDDVVTVPVMTAVSVVRPSIGRALRSGRWKKLGRAHCALPLNPRMTVHWPVGTLKVSVWQGRTPSHDTLVHDPAIQSLEIIDAWDAEHHIPNGQQPTSGLNPQNGILEG